MKMNKFQNKKIQKTKLHAIPLILVGIICGPVSGSFQAWGSFAALYRSLSGRFSVMEALLRNKKKLFQNYSVDKVKKL